MARKASRISPDRLSPPRADEVSAWGSELALLAKVGIPFRTSPLPGGGLEIAIPSLDSSILRIQLLPGFPKSAPRLFLEKGALSVIPLSIEASSWTRGTRLVGLVMSLRKRGFSVQPLEREQRFLLWLGAECQALHQSGFEASIRSAKDGSILVLVQSGVRRIGLRLEREREGYSIELIRDRPVVDVPPDYSANGKDTLSTLGFPEVSTLLDVVRSIEQDERLWVPPGEVQSRRSETNDASPDPEKPWRDGSGSSRKFSSRVRLDYGVEHFIARQVANDSPRESAGLLLGDWNDSWGWWVREATGPGPNATQDGSHICPDERYLNAMKRDGERRGLTYLGEWHSHPPGFNRPSSGDVESIKAKVRSMNLTFYIAGIVPMDSGVLELNLYLFGPKHEDEYLGRFPLPNASTERRGVRAWLLRSGH